MNDHPIWSVRSETFADALLDPDQLIPNGVGRGNEAAPKRFSVYRNNVVVSLMEALSEIFPSVRALIGETNFDKVTRAYIASSPPRSPMIQAYGNTFGDYLERLPAMRDLPFMGDVARLERAWLDAYHAVDATPLNPEQLAGLSPEETMELRFEAHPAARLVRSEHPVFDLFNAREHWPNPDIDFHQAQTVLVTRPELSVMLQPLDNGLQAFFSSLFSGAPLSEAIGNAMAADEAFNPAGAIQFAFEIGAFHAFNLSDQPHNSKAA